MRSLRVLSFAVSLCIICGIIFGPISASAIYELEIDPWGDLEDVKNPGITDMPMAPELPDPPDQEDPAGEGGVSLLSLNDDNAARYVLVDSTTSEKGIYYGTSSSTSGRVAVTDTKMIKTYEGAGYYQIGQKTYSSSSDDWYLRGTVNGFVDWSAPVEYDASTSKYIVVSGGGSAKVVTSDETVAYAESMELWSGMLEMYPQQVQMLVNEELYGEAILCDSQGRFTFPEGIEIALNDSVYEVGLRFVFNDITLSGQTDSYYSVRSCYFYIDDSAVFTVRETIQEPEYSGLLGTIIGWLTNLWEAITGLPDRIVGGLLDGLSGLFVPSEEDVTALKAKYDTLLRDRLGFIYQGFDATVTNVETIVTNMEAVEEYSFTVPEISFTLNGQKLVILDETPVSLDNAAMDVLRGLFGTAVCVICVGAWLSLAFDMVVALISGIGYFEFLTKRKEEELYE